MSRLSSMRKALLYTACMLLLPLLRGCEAAAAHPSDESSSAQDQFNLQPSGQDDKVIAGNAPRWAAIVKRLVGLGTEGSESEEARLLRGEMVAQLKADWLQLEQAASLRLVPLLSDVVVAIPRGGSVAALATRWEETVPQTLGLSLAQYSARLGELASARRAVRRAAKVPAGLSVPEPSRVAYRAPSSGGKGEAEGVELGETGGVVAVYDTFVGEEEAVELLALGQKLVGKAEARLAAKGEAKPKGTEYMGRATLSSSQEAGRNPSYRAVAQRVSAVVGIKEHPTDTAYFVAQHPHSNMGQPHHDQNHRPLRWWTVLIYLSDQPEVSGGTTFPCYAPIEPTDDRGLAIEGAEGARADPQGERSALGNAVVSTIAQQHKSAPPPLGAHDEELCRTLVNGYQAGWRAVDSSPKAKTGWNSTAYELLKGGCNAEPKESTCLRVIFPSARTDGQPLPTQWHAACTVAEGADPKITLQFFKEFPEDEMPWVLRQNSTMRELAKNDRYREKEKAKAAKAQKN